VKTVLENAQHCFCINCVEKLKNSHAKWRVKFSAEAIKCKQGKNKTLDKEVVDFT
jgi:hypothetical protein